MQAASPSEEGPTLEDMERREAETLKRLLATPPDHRRKVKSDASPKKGSGSPKTPARGSNEKADNRD